MAVTLKLDYSGLLSLSLSFMRYDSTEYYKFVSSAVRIARVPSVFATLVLKHFNDDRAVKINQVRTGVTTTEK